MTTVRFVGKSKVHGAEYAEHHTWGGGTMPAEKSATPPPARKTGLVRANETEKLFFQLKEFEEFRQPSFNTLYVQIPRPSFSRSPIMEALSSVVAETVELLEPLRQLLLPQNSLKDKLPYFREDHSPLPNNVRPRVQKVLRMNVEFAEQQHAKGELAAVEWKRLKQQRQDAKRSMKGQSLKQQEVAAKRLQALLQDDSHDHVHIPHPHFYTGVMPSWLVPALNVAAWAYLCGFMDLLKQ